MNKPRIAIFDFACCEGCQLQIVNMEEELLSLLEHVDPVEWREAMSDQSDDYDIAIVEGSITREEDAERLREIRKRASVVIALGACATIGGVNSLKNLFHLDEVKSEVYAESAGLPHLNTAPVQALHEVIEVDYKIEGCPIDASELAYVVKCLLVGKVPVVLSQPVCVECKLRENGCRFDYGEICLGPLTKGGCGARCPTNGTWCFGCRGPVDEPNVEAAREIMAHYGKTVEDLKRKLDLFGAEQEVFRG
jgi:coenzyme F420-reducing hydrogenase gamma subunit